MSLRERILVAPRLLWAAPCSALGLLGAAVIVAAGGRWRRVGRTLEVFAHPGELPGASPLRALPFAAMTLGHVVLGVSGNVLVRVRRHEHVHVAQYERWGPLFLLAYPAASVWAWLRGEGAYRGNRFERQAHDTSRNAG